jgi:hypothetical protein
MNLWVFRHKLDTTERALFCQKSAGKLGVLQGGRRVRITEPPRQTANGAHTDVELFRTAKRPTGRQLWPVSRRNWVWPGSTSWRDAVLHAFILAAILCLAFFGEKLFMTLYKGPSAEAKYSFWMPIGGAAASIYIGHLAHLWRTGVLF